MVRAALDCREGGFFRRRSRSEPRCAATTMITHAQREKRLAIWISNTRLRMRSTEGPPGGSRPGFAFATWRPHLQGCIRYDCQGDEAGIIMLRRVSHSCHLCSNCERFTLPCHCRASRSVPSCKTLMSSEQRLGDTCTPVIHSCHHLTPMHFVSRRVDLSSIYSYITGCIPAQARFHY
jgi:hypothetical protein